MVAKQIRFKLAIQASLIIRKAVKFLLTHSMFLLRVHQNPLGVVWLSLTGN